MLKIKIDKDKCNVEIGGTLLNLSAEMMMAIHHVYEAVEEASEGCGETFKDIITNNIKVAFMGEKELEDSIDETPKDKLIETLETVLEKLKEDS